MATTSFKQQCPSCEAMVPVRDPNLIGRKIDCPKCKYRFVVEEPAGNGAAEEPAEATVTTKARAKGQRGTATGPAVKTAGARRRRGEDEDHIEEPAAPKPKSTTKAPIFIISGVVGVVALVLLVIAGLWMFGVFDGEEPPKTQPVTQPKKDVPKEPPAAPVPTLAEITNLLPNTTEAVLRLEVRELLNSPIGIAAFDTKGAFRREAIEQQLGLRLDDIDRVLVAGNFTDGWIFGIVRTASAINRDTMKEKLHLLPESQKVQDLEYFLTEPIQWLDDVQRLATDLAAPYLEEEKKKRKPATPQERPSQARSLAVYLMDDQTLVMA
ncbi:MAG TPA: hypothetical protein VKI65_07275, partial [Gemmataceae bacterium]|nr:hypothetical protein [Gemmataceae bacterium]